ncbi:zinc finger MYM-type protein 1 [Trichonephila clavipes]|nr:zinc finger MYM-type protein 1 [Trichonephila clavipes]
MRGHFLAKKGTGILQNFRRDLTLHSAKLEIKRIFRESFRLTASRVARDKPWSTLCKKSHGIPSSPRAAAVAKFRLLTGHDCLCAHLFIVQREYISNAPTEKCLENVGFEFEKYVDVGSWPKSLNKQLQEQLRKDTKYYHNVIKRVIAVVKYLAIRDLAFRGTEEVLGSPSNGNFMGALKLLAEFDPFIHEHIELRELRPKNR